MGVPDSEVLIFPPVGYGYNIPYWDFLKFYVRDYPDRDWLLQEVLANEK